MVRAWNHARLCFSSRYSLYVQMINPPRCRDRPLARSRHNQFVRTKKSKTSRPKSTWHAPDTSPAQMYVSKPPTAMTWPCYDPHRSAAAPCLPGTRSLLKHYSIWQRLNQSAYSLSHLPLPSPSVGVKPSHVMLKHSDWLLDFGPWFFFLLLNCGFRETTSLCALEKRDDPPPPTRQTCLLDTSRPSLYRSFSSHSPQLVSQPLATLPVPPVGLRAFAASAAGKPGSAARLFPTLLRNKRAQAIRVA
ncbi:hypothetical protein BKA81DRAFT_350497, partial [Phyllosticta paracitricarpa]